MNELFTGEWTSDRKKWEMTVESTEIWKKRGKAWESWSEIQRALRDFANKNRLRVLYVWPYYRVSCNQFFFFFLDLVVLYWLMMPMENSVDLWSSTLGDKRVISKKN